VAEQVRPLLLRRAAS